MTMMQIMRSQLGDKRFRSLLFPAFLLGYFLSWGITSYFDASQPPPFGFENARWLYHEFGGGDCLAAGSVVKFPFKTITNSKP